MHASLGTNRRRRASHSERPAPAPPALLPPSENPAPTALDFVLNRGYSCLFVASRSSSQIYERNSKRGPTARYRPVHSVSLRPVSNVNGFLHLFTPFYTFLHKELFQTMRPSLCPIAGGSRSQRFTTLQKVAQACTELHWLAHDCTRLHTIAQNCTRLHRIAQNCTELR